MPEMQLIEAPVHELALYHRNPRRGNVKAIAESLSARGQYRAIVVNLGSLTGRPMEVLAGNHTLLAARSLGWPTIKATTVDVDEATAAQIVAADNRLADLGDYDDAALAELLQVAGELDGTGYSDADLQLLLRGLEEPVALTEPDDVPDLPEEPVSRPGDLWELGPHLLLVGDATDLGSLRAAFPEPVDCIWTDPPYGVNYVGGSGLSIKNDGADEAKALIGDALKAAVAVARPGAPVYIAHSDVVRAAFQDAMAAAGIRFRQTLIWVKNSLVLSRADYHYRHEPILEGAVGDDEDWSPVAYGFGPGGEGRLGRGGPNWHGDNRQTTVFEVPRPKRSSVHPTMKPVELVERQLRNSCPPGGQVLDLFAGSGTTMIAAHRLRLKARLVELDPRYADVICRRWEEHTGIAPVRGGELVRFTGGA